jgi:hypothetical protein
MIISLIITAGVGILISVFGIINMTGNISSLHWYHRQRVTEEDRKPFGRLVGLGTLIIGVAIIVFGMLMFIYEKTRIGFCAVIGSAELIAGIILGFVLSIYAMIKYNKGIF